LVAKDITRGSDVTWLLKLWQDAAKTLAFDLTGVSLSVFEYVDPTTSAPEGTSTLLPTLSTSGTPIDGHINVVLSNTQTAALEAGGRYAFSIALSWQDGRDKVIGPFVARAR
jgi:hypothetical protein